MARGERVSKAARADRGAKFRSDAGPDHEIRPDARADDDSGADDGRRRPPRLWADDDGAPDRSPTPQPTPVPTEAPVVTGAVALSGITVAEAESSKAVLQDAIAQVAGVATEAVTILSVASARRRLQEGGVVVAYKIESNDFAEAADAADKLQAAADDPSVVDTAIEEAAKDANAGQFCGRQHRVAHVRRRRRDRRADRSAHDVLGQQEKRKEDTRLLIVIIVCAVAGCCCLAALSMACFAKHKKSPEPPPIKAPPISLGGVDVDVSQEGCCARPPCRHGLRAARGLVQRA